MERRGRRRRDSGETMVTVVSTPLSASAENVQRCTLLSQHTSLVVVLALPHLATRSSLPYSLSSCPRYHTRQVHGSSLSSYFSLLCEGHASDRLLHGNARPFSCLPGQRGRNYGIPLHGNPTLT